MNNYAHIFVLLMRLRQAVDHPYLVVYSKTTAQNFENLVDSHNVEQVCGICHDPAGTSCSQVFCKACLLDFSSSLGQVSNDDGEDQTVKTTNKGYRSSNILNTIQLNDFQTSTKIEALREEIRSMVERRALRKGIVSASSRHCWIL